MITRRRLYIAAAVMFGLALILEVVTLRIEMNKLRASGLLDTLPHTNP